VDRCVLCDQPFTVHVVGRWYELTAVMILVHDACVVALIRRELAHRHASRPITAGCEVTY
jgi:hypothetical protein